MDTRSQLALLALASLNDEACPPPERLAAHLLGTLEGALQLQIAAHVRRCPLCQEDLALARPPEARPRRLVARLLPSFVGGLRGAPEAALVRRYQAADLVVELTFTSPQGDYWRLTGQVLRGSLGVPDRDIALRAGRRLRRQTASDSEGFFTFEDLPGGDYTLSVADGNTVVQVRGLALHQGDG